jgi:hypothetical protein
VQKSEIIDDGIYKRDLDCGVISISEITTPGSSTGEITPSYSYYLCFSITELSKK